MKIDIDQALDIRTCQNPYSGETCELPDFASTIYYNIKDAEWVGHYGVVRKGLDWFKKYFAKEYMVLLD